MNRITRTILKTLSRQVLAPAAALLLLSGNASASYSISRLEPPNWWAGMKNNQLELMVYGPAISDLKPVINDTMVLISEVISVKSPNYLFILLELDPDITPRVFDILFQKEGRTKVSYKYSILPREPGSAGRRGFDNSDVIYLITPDRFANGDPGNDNMAGYTELANRTDKNGRHGGDLKGISDHLDYIADMGFTAVWLNPVLENNMPRTSYHGYAITDFYKVDARLGSNEEYRQLSQSMKASGLKLIMDMVENHCGSEHWWMKDLPTDDWINFRGRFVQDNHRRTTVQDPHASPSDKKYFTEGWFARSMPDLNQKNPLLARYLIQNSIWWIEYAGLSGIRQDTYSYPDKDFMRRWSCAIMSEYPNFSIVGEEYSENQAIVAYWQKGKVNPDGYTSCLGSVLDFPLQDALVKGLTESDMFYKDGLVKMYEALAMDFLYADPSRLVIFPDNHDMKRFFTQVNEDYDLFRMGIAYILTMRGIPQIFYGTEILMTSPGEKKEDGIIRSDFPGGWQGDSVNAFTGEGLTNQQKDSQEFLKFMLNWRKARSCLRNGKLIHYIPENGTYVYFRMNDAEKVMVAFNKNNHAVTLNGGRFKEITGDATMGKNVVNGSSMSLDSIDLPARSFLVLEY